LLDYREALRGVGIHSGYQWLDGSFVEDVETNRGRPPSDIDIVTVAYRPPVPDWAQFVRMNIALFDPDQVKAAHRCDAYFIDLGTAPHIVVRNTCYWFGLFTHQRETFLWKGMLLLPLSSDDALARAML